MPLRSIYKPPIARVKTGRYTGDGTTAQAITGIGFRPKYVKIWQHATADETYVEFYERTDQFHTEFAAGHFTSAYYHNVWSDKIISLDPDGFTVDDDGIDAHPNKLNQEYNFLALG